MSLLRRHPMKPRSAHADPVTPEVRRSVLERDVVCFLYRLDPDHVCRDQWGTPHAPDAYWRLQVDHVKAHARLGRRAPSDLAHLVAMCAAANIGVPSKAVREAERGYLAAFYPEAWS